MIGAIGQGVAGLLLALAGVAPARAGAPDRPVMPACGPSAPVAEPIARASVRFAIPEALIHSVIAAESNYAALAVSPKGAMGLMQLMPATWAELRRRYALGADPFDVCDNIFAGTAYLRGLLDRYGDPGFLAAYNAGPGRYEAYLRGARPLPRETLAYVARLSSTRLADASPAAQVAHDPDAWRRAALFVGASGSPAEPAAAPAAGGASTPSSAADVRRPVASPDAIFVPLTGAPR